MRPPEAVLLLVQSVVERAVLLLVSAVDAGGNVASQANGDSVMVSFAVLQGPAVVSGTCNGNPTDHTVAKSAVRGVYVGLAKAVVTSTGGGGTVGVLQASAPGFAAVNITIDVE